MKNIFKKILLFTICGLILDKNITFAEEISNKMLVGIGVDFGFSEIENKDFYLKSYLSNGGGVFGLMNSVFDAKLDYAYRGSLMLEYVMQNNFLYGFEINYSEVKNFNNTKELSSEYMINKIGGVMGRAGYILDWNIVKPYVAVGIGMEHIRLDGNFLLYGIDPDRIILLVDQKLKDIGYNRLSFSAEAGVAVSFKNYLIGANYKFVNGINFGDDYKDLDNINDLSKNIETTAGKVYEVQSLQMQKFVSQLHMAGVFIKIAI